MLSRVKIGVTSSMQNENGNFHGAAAIVGLLWTGLRVHDAGLGHSENENKDVEVCVMHID